VVRQDLGVTTRPLMRALRIRIGVAIGLLFLVGPLDGLASAGLSTARTCAIVACTALFILIYGMVLPSSPWLGRLGRLQVGAPLAALALLAVVVLALGAPDAFVSLFVYVVAVAGIRLSVRSAIGVIVAVTLGVGLGMWLGGSSSGDTASFLIVIIAIGAMMAAFGRKIAANHELREAREELAVMAVSEERLRIARDLHDLLGHSLSVIALKSELAARLLEQEPRRAAEEIEDIRTVTRQALAEVREAVQGYRRQGLADALERAEEALAAAGIACELDRAPASLPADVESVLAWAVREGTTNVVRHSGAGHCSIRVRTEADAAAVEVYDDGASAGELGRGGSGLAGLAERAHNLSGTLEAGAAPAGGFRLRLSVPLQRA
jgi:two-component system, NarL family, sensor histidine kinase DesK